MSAGWRGRRPARKQDVDRDWLSHHRKPARYSPRDCTCVTATAQRTNALITRTRGFTPYKNNSHTWSDLSRMSSREFSRADTPRRGARFLHGFKRMTHLFRVPFRFETYKYMCMCYPVALAPASCDSTEHCCAGARAPGPRGPAVGSPGAGISGDNARFHVRITGAAPKHNMRCAGSKRPLDGLRLCHRPNGQGSGPPPHPIGGAEQER